MADKCTWDETKHGGQPCPTHEGSADEKVLSNKVKKDSKQDKLQNIYKKLDDAGIHFSVDDGYFEFDSDDDKEKAYRILKNEVGDENIGFHGMSLSVNLEEDFDDDYDFENWDINDYEEIKNRVIKMIKDGKDNTEIKNVLEQADEENFDWYEADDYINAVRDELSGDAQSYMMDKMFKQYGDRVKPYDEALKELNKNDIPKPTPKEDGSWKLTPEIEKNIKDNFKTAKEAYNAVGIIFGKGWDDGSDYAEKRIKDYNEIIKAINKIYGSNLSEYKK